MPSSWTPLRGILALASVLVLSSCTAPASKSPQSPVGPARSSSERIDAANSAIASDSLDTQAWFDLALAWHDDNRATSSDSALAAFEHLQRIDPENVRATVHYGLALEDAKRFDEALAKYELASKLAPKDPVAFINMGSLLYFQFKRTYEAKIALTKAIELDPRNADARFNMGVLFADAHMFQEARAEWEQVLAVGSEGPAANLARENLDRILPFLESQPK